MSETFYQRGTPAGCAFLVVVVVVVLLVVILCGVPFAVCLFGLGA